MSRFTKILVCVILVVGCLCGCSKIDTLTEDQTLTFMDLSITLPGYFEDRLHSDYTAKDTFMYGVYEITVTGVREDKTLFDQVPTLEEYGNLLISGNNLSATLQQEDGLTTFTFSLMDGKNSFTHLAAIYEGTGAFWLVQFSCRTENFDDSRESFLTYLKSVTVS